MSKQSFLKGTFILIIAGLVTKLLGFMNRIVVARMMGEEGVGLYMMAVPTFLLTITLTQLGLPVAISKRVAEAESEGNQEKIKRILVVSLSITIALSIIFTIGLLAIAPFLATYFFTDARTYYPLLAIAPVVPIIALSAVLRGYFQGKQNMAPSAISQVIEQIVRISLVAILVSLFLPYGVEFAAAGAMVSVALGELASLLYMLTMFKLKKRFRVRTQFFNYVKSGKKTFYELMRIALPTTGSRLIGSISYFFEPIVVAQSLAIAGVATAVATKQYGALTGYALPLLFLPSFITTSLSISLIPAISEAAAKRQSLLIEHRLQQALRLALVAGGISVVVLYVFAEPLMELMYNTAQAAVFVKIMAPFFLLYYFQGPLQATLQALDLAKAAMMNSIFGAIIKIIAIFTLATRPEFGIMGAALAIVIGFTVVTALHFATILKTISYTIYVREYLKCFAIIIVSGIIGHLLYHHLFHELMLGSRVICSIAITVIVYCILLFCAKLIHPAEVQRIPLIGRLLFPAKRK